MTYDQHVAIKQPIEASLRPTSKYQMSYLTTQSLQLFSFIFISKVYYSCHHTRSDYIVALKSCHLLNVIKKTFDLWRMCMRQERWFIKLLKE